MVTSENSGMKWILASDGRLHQVPVNVVKIYVAPVAITGTTTAKEKA